MQQRPPRIVLLTTAPSSLRTFFASQVRFLRSSGFRVHTISAPAASAAGQKWAASAAGQKWAASAAGQKWPASAAGQKWPAPGNGPDRRLPMHQIPMLRKISPVSDLRAICRLCVLLRRIRPAIIHTHTPKAGLLGMIAASLTGVGVRIFTINGLVWETKKGWNRRLLRMTEWLSCTLATEVLIVSPSLREIAIHEGICPPNKIRVLGYGGSHGVDLDRFDPTSADTIAAELRTRLNIPANSLVLTFVGRLVREKGIGDLALAWNIIRDEFPTAWLLLCGDLEDRGPVSPEILAGLRSCPRVRFSNGSPAEMPAFYAATDICVLPTWREGLPNAALEAGAMKRPIVATKIPGCVDAIQDGVTGILVEPRDPEALATALRSLLSDAPLRRRMGESARTFVSQRFSERDVSARLAAEYRRLLGDPVPNTLQVSVEP